MGYIRNNEDYYVSQGFSPKQASIQTKIDNCHIDYGFCNPNKAKEAAKVEKEIKEKEGNQNDS